MLRASPLPAPARPIGRLSSINKLNCGKYYRAGWSLVNEYSQRLLPIRISAASRGLAHMAIKPAGGSADCAASPQSA